MTLEVWVLTCEQNTTFGFYTTRFHYIVHSAPGFRWTCRLLLEILLLPLEVSFFYEWADGNSACWLVRRCSDVRWGSSSCAAVPVGANTGASSCNALLWAVSTTETQ